MKPLSIKQILEDLNNGLTRLKKDDFGKGSIQEKYDLTMLEVFDLFKHEKLAGRVTKKWGNGISFIIIDDVDIEGTLDNTIVLDKEEEQTLVDSETAGEMLLRTQAAVEEFVKKEDNQ